MSGEFESFSGVLGCFQWNIRRTNPTSSLGGLEHPLRRPITFPDRFFTADA
jgi:hypothetical protein